MDFNDLYYFYLIAEHQGFTAAERASGLTKSLLSRRIAQLEDRLKVRLIQRNSRHFSLTTAGRMLHEHAAEMVREGRAAYDSLNLHAAEPSGIIRISSPTVLAQYHLAPLLPGFMRRYPEVNVFLDATDRPVQIIEERIDLALRAHRLIDNEPGLIVRPLATSHLVLVASPAFLTAYGEPQTPQDICLLPTISAVTDRHEGELRWELTCHSGEPEVVRHRPVLFCLNPRVQLEAALQGIGIGLLPRSIAGPAIASGALKQLLPSWSTHHHIIHAVFPSRKHMNPAIRVFLDYLVAELPASLEC